MAGPYSREFGERQAAKLVENGQIEVRADGSVWRLRHVNPSRAHAQRRIDYPGTRTAHRTLRVNVKGVLYSVQAHRLVWQLKHGDIPAGVVVNHKDGDPSNNRIENLELVTQSENQLHRFRELGHVPSVTVLRQRYEQVVSAARTAVETGLLGDLEKALAAFDAGEARGERKRQNYRKKRVQK